MKKLFAFTVLVATSSTTFGDDFIKDSTVSLTTRNYYLHKNFYSFDVPSAHSWAQGVILDAKSGYTPGKVQFGLDLMATAAYNLDSKNAGRGVYMVPGDDSTSWGDIAVTGKAKVSQTEMKAGAISMMNPVFITSQARVLPQFYQGVSITSKDIPNLDLSAAYVNKVNQRDSSDWEKISMANTNRRFKTQATTDSAYFLGGYYKLSPNTKAHLFYFNAKDLYNQLEGGVENTYVLNNKDKLLSDVKYYRSRDVGKANAGRVDNNAIVANFGIQRDVHKISLGTMQNSGDTAFPYLYDSEVGTFLDTWPSDFLNTNEKVYSIRYDYDAKNIIPGLRFMTRYTYGNDINTTNNQSIGANKNAFGGDGRHESELDFDIGYRVQQGPLKNLGFRVRHAILDNNMTVSAPIKPTRETRVNVDYTWKFK